MLLSSLSLILIHVSTGSCKNIMLLLFLNLFFNILINVDFPDPIFPSNEIIIGFLDFENSFSNDKFVVSDEATLWATEPIFSKKRKDS